MQWTDDLTWFGGTEDPLHERASPSSFLAILPLVNWWQLHTNMLINPSLTRRNKRHAKCRLDLAEWGWGGRGSQGSKFRTYETPRPLIDGNETTSIILQSYMLVKVPAHMCINSVEFGSRLFRVHPKMFPDHAVLMFQGHARGNSSMIPTKPGLAAWKVAFTVASEAIVI